MNTKTRNGGKLLLWVTWLAVLLCILLIVVVLLHRGIYRDETAETEQTQTVTVPDQEETIRETEPETGRPVLNLEANPYTAEDFDFRGRYLECAAGPSKIGVDVSAWQKEVNWPLVKAAGMEFAMLRFAMRGSTEGGLWVDDYAQANYRGAKDAGLEVGGYFFSQALSVEEAIEEAEFVLELVKDWKLELPIVFDWEQTWERTSNMDPRTLTDCAKAFCQTIEEAGFEAMVYFNMNQAYDDIYLEELTEYDFWLALYESDMVFPYKVDMWQYSCTGSVPGVEGPVDLNILFEYE